MYEIFFEKLMEECEIRNRSANTARTYTDNIKRFLLDAGKHPDQLLLEDARMYILKNAGKVYLLNTVTTSIHPLLSFTNMSCISSGIRKSFPE